MRFLICLLILISITCPTAFAGGSSHCANNSSHNHAGHANSHHNNHHSSSGNSSNPVYLIKKDFETKEVKFPNCDRHYVISEITTDYFSDGSKRIYTNSTVYNTDGTVLISDCQSVKHTIYEDKHFFIIRQNRGYKILNDDGETISTKNYSYMEEIIPNRIKVRYDKKYGVIDLNEKVIIPIKYQSLENYGNKIFLSKLNRYYGIIDIENNILVENDCDKIKPAYDTFIIKRYDKYGLADTNGHLVLNIQYDKIKKLGEYIIIKKNIRYGVLDSYGKIISEPQYKKIKLERNHLIGEKFNGNKEELKINEL